MGRKPPQVQTILLIFEQTFNEAACKAQISTLQYRHRLIPYLYTCNHLSARDGVPLVVPMYWDYPTLGPGFPGIAYTVPNQFLFGSQLMVAPITSPIDPSTQMSQTEIWFPPGSRYVDIFTSAVYDGDCKVKLHRTLDGYPVFAKEGALIPLDAAASPPNTCGNPTTIELLVVVGADGEFDLLEDDGTGSIIEEVKTITTPIRFSQSTGTLKIGPCSAPGPDRKWTIRFLAYNGSPKSVFLDSNEISDYKSASPDSATVLSINVPAQSTLSIKLEASPQLAPTDIKKFVFPILDRAQMDYGGKSEIWEGITAKGAKTSKIQRIVAAKGVPQMVKEAVLEYVLADERSVL